jgi:hypothetical protein
MAQKRSKRKVSKISSTISIAKRGAATARMEDEFPSIEGSRISPTRIPTVNLMG